MSSPPGQTPAARNFERQPPAAGQVHGRPAGTQHLCTGKWHTPKRQEAREFEIGCDLNVQRLVLDPLVPGDRLQRITVQVPVPGDSTWAVCISELRRSIAKIESGPGRPFAAEGPLNRSPRL